MLQPTATDVTTDVPLGLEPLVSAGRGHAGGVEAFAPQKLPALLVYGLLSLSANRTRLRALDGVAARSASDLPLAASVLTHVDAHLGEGISLAGLAAVVRLSVPQFTRAFRASTGTSPARLVRGRRVERAKALLAGPTCAIAEVALAACFADQRHLTRPFREATGTTPAAFRAAIG